MARPSTTVGEIASNASTANRMLKVSARPTRLETFSAWVGITAKNAIASQAASGGMQRRANIQPTSTRAR